MTSQRSSRSGARPRHELIPPGIVGTYGDLAAELMERAGKPLDPWQVDACNLMLAYRADGTWACSEYCEWVARQNGKGAILEARALVGFLLLGEELIAWSAHEVKTAMEAFRRVRALLVRLGRLPNPRDQNLIEVQLGEDTWCQVRVNNTNGHEGFERLDTGQRIKFVARSKGSGRGFTAAVQIVDETFAYTLAQQDALAPTTLAVADEQTVYTSTPPLNGLSGEVMYSLRARAEAGGDDSLGYRDWGLGGWLDELDGVDLGGPDERPPVDVDDPQLWARTNPALGSRIKVERLAKLRRKLGKLGFARESLCVWPRPVQVGAGVIDLELWAERGDPTSRPAPGSPLVFGIDASPGGRSAAIASGGCREDERLHTKIVDYRPGTGWVVARAVELRDRYKPVAFLLDPSGPAGALLGDLLAAGIDPILVSGREMAQACGALVNDLKDDRWRHCDQEALNAAVEQSTTRASADAWVWARRDFDGDVCPLYAVTLARHGFRVHGVRVEHEPMAAWV